MMRISFVLFCSTILYLGVNSYRGDKVVRVTPTTSEDLVKLQKILDETSTIDIWRPPVATNSSVDIRLTPSNYDDIIGYLLEMGLEPEILIDNVDSLIEEQIATYERLKFQPKETQFNYSRYHTLDEINAWIKNITNVYKDIARPIDIASSYEGRQLTGIKISVPGTVKKPGFWIEGGIHAREWISPATVLYMAGQMLDQFKHDPQITAMVKTFDWYILPVTNPDGYVYTWTGTKQSRLWRKTRSKHGLCIGVDPNRNWDMDWCAKGASKDPCSDTYCGPKAFSESEVRGVAQFIQNNTGIKAFIDFHSYSQLWMSPWGYTKTKPKDFAAQDKGSQTAVDALFKVYGTGYKHGTLASTVYISSGSSADWTYGKAGIKFSYGVELRDKGKYGFLLPEDQILPSGKETLQGLIALSNYVYNN